MPFADARERDGDDGDAEQAMREVVRVMRPCGHELPCVGAPEDASGEEEVEESRRAPHQVRERAKEGGPPDEVAFPHDGRAPERMGEEVHRGNQQPITYDQQPTTNERRETSRQS